MNTAEKQLDQLDALLRELWAAGEDTWQDIVLQVEELLAEIEDSFQNLEE